MAGNVYGQWNLYTTMPVNFVGHIWKSHISISPQLYRLGLNMSCDYLLRPVWIYYLDRAFKELNSFIEVRVVDISI